MDEWLYPDMSGITMPAWGWVREEHAFRGGGAMRSLEPRDAELSPNPDTNTNTNTHSNTNTNTNTNPTYRSPESRAAEKLATEKGLSIGRERARMKRMSKGSEVMDALNGERIQTV